MSEAARPPAEFDFPLSWAGPDGIGEPRFDEVAEVERPDVTRATTRPSRCGAPSGCSRPASRSITTLKGEQVHGMTANAFMSVSLEPPLVLVSIDRRTKMCGLLHVGGHYGVSVLCETQSALSDRFAGRPADGAAEPRFDLVRETPLVDGALAHFVACVEHSYWGGDHSLFLGRVEYARQHSGAPLLFHGGRYVRTAGGAGARR